MPETLSEIFHDLVFLVYLKTLEETNKGIVWTQNTLIVFQFLIKYPGFAHYLLQNDIDNDYIILCDATEKTLRNHSPASSIKEIAFVPGRSCIGVRQRQYYVCDALAELPLHQPGTDHGQNYLW